MKLYVTHSTSFDYKNELYTPLRNSELNAKHQIILPHESQGQPINSKKIIQDCDVVVAEVSSPSTGQGIELGWADVFDKSIICIFRAGTYPSSSLGLISEHFIEYSDTQELLSMLAKFLETNSSD